LKSAHTVFQDKDIIVRHRTMIESLINKLCKIEHGSDGQLYMFIYRVDYKILHMEYYVFLVKTGGELVPIVTNGQLTP
jgi:hypothetical protein